MELTLTKQNRLGHYCTINDCGVKHRKNLLLEIFSVSNILVLSFIFGTDTMLILSLSQ